MVKNILYCESNTDGTIGGSYYSLYYLVKGLDRNEFQPFVIFHKSHKLIDAFLESNIPVKILALPKPIKLEYFPYKIFRLFSRSLNFLRFLIFQSIKYALFLRKHKINIVHLNNSITRNHAWILAAFLCRIPCLTHQRGINQKYSRLDHLFSKYLSSIICISKAVRQNLLDHGFTFSKLHLIYNGLDPSQLKIVKSRRTLLNTLKLSPENNIICVLGNIKEWKGQEVAIYAMSSLIISYPNLVCIFVGDTSSEDKYYAEMLNRLIRKFSLENNIYFSGYQSNVADWINISDIIIHTSTKPEPFGRILLEGMAFCKPVIGSNSGGAPEIIKNNNSGLLYPPGDHRLLAKLIAYLLENPKIAENIGKSGYKRLCQRFHIKTNIELTQNLYRIL
jgi:L-malate glycosyltransferase